MSRQLRALAGLLLGWSLVALPHGVIEADDAIVRHATALQPTGVVHLASIDGGAAYRGLAAHRHDAELFLRAVASAECSPRSSPLDVSQDIPLELARGSIARIDFTGPGEGASGDHPGSHNLPRSSAREPAAIWGIILAGVIGICALGCRPSSAGRMGTGALLSVGQTRGLSGFQRTRSKH
jgi:hypothetical protein